MQKGKIFLLIFIVFCLSLIPTVDYSESGHKGSKVELTGTITRWQLIVNGRPFFIRGIGCAVPAEEELLDAYFKLAKEIGANSIRRWGVEADTRFVLDKAAEYGLMVNQGIWIVSGSGFASNLQYRSSQINIILDAVRRYNDHPSLLMWNIGNENIENLDKKEDKIAFCQFLNEVCEKIHQIDPNHPVVYTGIMGQSLKLLKNFAPSLDIYGANAYAGINKFRSEWKSSSINIPYLFSEYGPDGHWEVGCDKWGQPQEPLDGEKAKQFNKRWEDYIQRFKGDCLGGYAFLLEEKQEVSETWWGVTYEMLRRASYWTLYQLYTGKIPPNNAPEIKDLHLSPSGPLKGMQKLRIRADASDPDRDPITYTLKAPAEGGAFWTQKPEMDKFEYQVPSVPGVYRLYVIVKDNHKNVSTASATFKVSSVNPAGDRS